MIHLARYRHLHHVEQAPAAAVSQPSRLDRMRASLDQSVLDQRIVSEIWDVGDRQLVARCWQLTRPRTRAHLADMLARVVHDSDEMHFAAGTGGRAAHRGIRAARGELNQLMLRLHDARPVHPVGVARVSLLVGEAASPLYVPAKAPNVLWRDAHAARDALDRVWHELG